MNTSTLTRPGGASGGCGCGGGCGGGCGCGNAGLGQPMPVAGACAEGGAGTCETRGLARPRFFAGQLLTEDDLQSLADYVVQKSRLHNRHFVGDGVVCGLQVHCHPCGGGKLVVQAGHALDCCGNDLVLECAVELDANAMVRDLRRNLLGGYDCGDPCADGSSAAPRDARDPKNPKKHCDARHYALYMRYMEQASDPVAPYDSGDACGGSGCEATRVREGVRFELRCRTEPAPADGVLKRTKDCLFDLVRAEELSAALGRLSSGKGSPQDVAAARAAMLDQLDAAYPKGACSLRGQVAAIQVPTVGADLQPATDRLLDAWLAIGRDCFCNALLPPCPPCEDPGVLLATISIAECDVVAICNLDRKLVLTGPNLRYWFPMDVFGDMLETLCCPEEPCEEEQRGEIKGTQQPPAAGKPMAMASPQPFNVGGAPAAAPPQGTLPPQPPPPPPPPAADIGDPELLALRQRLQAYALRRFELTRLDAGRLLRVGENLGDVFASGALDRFPAARLLRRSDPRAPTRELLSRELAEAPAFRALKAQLEEQQSTRIDVARRELKEETTKANESLVAENKALRGQLDTVLERLQKLEAAAKPAKK